MIIAAFSPCSHIPEASHLPFASSHTFCVLTPEARAMFQAFQIDEAMAVHARPALSKGRSLFDVVDSVSVLG